ncbi:MAG: peptidoglycan DD-metalloendopeptidase family protein [Treponema sp.]|nr:peptidoglycan DD-metalloendopeptidase family protein [Treponema sp.]
MAQLHDYKRFENSLVRKVKNGALGAVKGIAAFFRALGRFLSRGYTLVLVPHSGKKTINLRVSLLMLFGIVVVLAGFAAALLWYGVSWNSAKDTIAARDSRLKDAQANLDQLRDEVAALLRQTKEFEPALRDALKAMGSEHGGAAGAGRGNSAAPAGDLSSFFDVRETPEGTLQEVEDLRRIAEYLSSAAKPIKEIGTQLSSQSALLSEIPNIWPIKGGIGHISTYFGQTENPFTGQYYIHKGIDLSTYRQGDPIVSTADGQVVAVYYDDLGGFGNNVIIQHKHGIYTRYGHLLSAKVKIGQRVSQGDVIGYIGNTGLSTGPHLHYEVHVGSDVVDPYKYLNVANTRSKTQTN